MQILLLITLTFLSGIIHAAEVHDFQTTRLMQLGGAGVGSLLTNESTVLNPASIVFSPASTVNYQRNTEVLKEQSAQRPSYFKEGATEFIGVQDVSTKLKGGFSYLYQNKQSTKRTRYSLSSAAPLTPTLSMGIIYTFTNEDSQIIDDTYHQFTIGFTQIINEKITLGLITVDPQNKISEYSHTILGFQYNMNDFVQFIGDIGSGDNANPEKEAISKIAIQIKSFDSFNIRYGKFYDKYQNIKGIGFGASWVGPKFSIDYAVKSSERISKSSDILFEDEKLIETSFALTALL